MGAYPSHGKHWAFPYLNERGMPSTLPVYEDTRIKYTSSWEWLMPVIEKIEQDPYVVIEIGKKHCTINQGFPVEPQGIEWICPIIQQLNSKHLSVIYAIVEFIRQYNNRELKLNGANATSAS